jgi:predicted nucleic-acid-binding protein
VLYRDPALLGLKGFGISCIVSTRNLYISDRDIIADALLLYSRKNIDFIDAYNAVYMNPSVA